MAALNTERVLSVKHWNDSLFSFTTTRDASLRFENGQFVMIGLTQDNGKPLLRAYSIVSANYEEHLEFFSIKVPDGPLTSRLQHLAVDDEVFVSTKPTGTLLISDLHPGRNLYLLSTGTGLAPFLSIVRDPETYERFDRVIVVHGVRYKNDLAYDTLLSHDLPEDDLLGELISGRLLYYPVVSREPFKHEGRLTTLLDNGRMTADLGIEDLDPAHDRAMICGSPAMLDDTAKLLDDRGFTVSPHIGAPGEYVIERAFVEK
ncbi:ferredoxin--NADP reductase [Salinisphaera sp. Q1T1-3]|uniref:ferredoxin--NADP reductase n=1 Tax=Salinisphaera sp. Q1T1-3 TaxID=2321229 RepID=UPI000E75E096|nr:ferredoxin--NADP reductase [Salinisphaera sp. Q1T1-3]RJS92695.1 ferredoxin--NADP reductase [Salinisphaera sp. Q1T1-3]